MPNPEALYPFARFNLDGAFHLRSIQRGICFRDRGWLGTRHRSIFDAAMIHSSCTAVFCLYDHHKNDTLQYDILRYKHPASQ
jgi:hypothetical protein